MAKIGPRELAMRAAREARAAGRGPGTEALGRVRELAAKTADLRTVAATVRPSLQDQIARRNQEDARREAREIRRAAKAELERRSAEAAGRSDAKGEARRAKRAAAHDRRSLRAVRDSDLDVPERPRGRGRPGIEGGGVRLTVTLPAGLHQEMADQAERSGVSVSEVVRVYCQAGVDEGVIIPGRGEGGA